MKPQQVVDYVTDGRDMKVTHIQALIAKLADVGPRTVAFWMSADMIPIERQALIYWRTDHALEPDENQK